MASIVPSTAPFLQVQPVRKEFYADRFLHNFAVKDLSGLSADRWQAFQRTVVAPNVAPDRKRGQIGLRMMLFSSIPYLLPNRGGCCHPHPSRSRVLVESKLNARGLRRQTAPAAAIGVMPISASSAKS